MNRDIFTFSDALHKKVIEFTKKQPAVDLVSTGKILSVIRGSLKELKAFTTGYSFVSSEDEVKFFKETKPILLSQHFYYKQLFSIQLINSCADQGCRMENYRSSLEKLQRFFRKNRPFYEYCISGDTHLDKTYFVLGCDSSGNIDKDESFTTGYDTKLSKILAGEMIRSYLIDSMEIIRLQSSSTQRSSLTWTAPKTDLVELIYGLNGAGVFNHATADIRKIVDCFETMFNVSLGNYYRTFLGIRIRKTGQTAFLDQLKERLVQRMNEIENKE